MLASAPARPASASRPLAARRKGLSGILITHEHSDHITGLLGLAGKLNIPIFCNRDTRDAIEFNFQTKFDCRLFATGASFEVGEITVDSFSIPHDALDPVGFLLHTPAGNIGFLTDLGHATKLVLERVRSANVLVLEANHDLKMLQDSSRPWSLKQRIAGRHGHLSNTEAADAAEAIMSADLKHLYLGHLSRECNEPQLAKRVILERLHKIGATHVKVELTAQQTPCATLSLAARIRSSYLQHACSDLRYESVISIVTARHALSVTVGLILGLALISMVNTPRQKPAPYNICVSSISGMVHKLCNIPPCPASTAAFPSSANP